MTIRRGAEWGAPGRLDPGAPIASSDRAAHDILNRPDGPPPELGLTGGSLHRSLGSPRNDEATLRRGASMRFPVDLGEVVLDGGSPRWFLSHLVAATARRGLWSSPTWVLTNGSFVDDLNLGPKAHPNDGRFDLTVGQLAYRQRRQALSRARTGTHLPHPDLEYRRVVELQLDDGEHWVSLDGGAPVRASSISVRCVPDALTIVV